MTARSLRTALLACAVVTVTATGAAANHQCAGVGGEPGGETRYGVCLSDDPPGVGVGSVPVQSPTRVCYVVDCVENGETIADVPAPVVEPGTVATACYPVSGDAAGSYERHCEDLGVS